MKTVFTIAALMVAATCAAGQDGTTSVLTTQAAPTPAATTTTQCVEVAKVAKLAPWQVRRLNRIADRQEARDARKCCCGTCACDNACDKCSNKCDCKTRTVVVEPRR